MSLQTGGSECMADNDSQLKSHKVLLWFISRNIFYFRADYTSYSFEVVHVQFNFNVSLLTATKWGGLKC